MLLAELFDTIRPYRWIKNDNTIKQAVFTASNGNQYSVEFTRFGYYHNEMPRDIITWEVTFNAGSDRIDRMTGTGAQFDVMATVIKITKEAIHNGVEGLHFAAYRNEPSKILLYNRLAKQLVQRYKWKLWDEGEFESKYEWWVAVPE